MPAHVSDNTIEANGSNTLGPTSHNQVGTESAGVKSNEENITRPTSNILDNSEIPILSTRPNSTRYPTEQYTTFLIHISGGDFRISIVSLTKSDA